jgi:hypothetical protein
MTAMVFAWLLSAFLVFALFATWNAPHDHRSVAQPGWWVWGERSWRGYRRAQVAWVLVMLSFALILTVPSPAGPVLGLGGFGLAVVSLVTIVLFNQPKWMVPPAMRTDTGLIHGWRRKRSEEER